MLERRERLAALQKQLLTRKLNLRRTWKRALRYRDYWKRLRKFWTTTPIDFVREKIFFAKIRKRHKFCPSSIARAILEIDETVSKIELAIAKAEKLAPDEDPPRIHKEMQDHPKPKPEHAKPPPEAAPRQPQQEHPRAQGRPKNPYLYAREKNHPEHDRYLEWRREHRKPRKPRAVKPKSSDLSYGH